MTLKTRFFLFLILLLFVSPSIDAGSIVIPNLAEQKAQYAKNRKKSIVELQQFRTHSSIIATVGTGKKGEATLINLNPYVNTGYLLILKADFLRQPETFHLENPFPNDHTFVLDPEFPKGILIEGNDKRYPCELWSSFPDGPLGESRDLAMPFAPFCDNLLYLRNTTKGKKTTVESVTDFLRRHVPGGEHITTFVKDTFYRDQYASTSEIIKEKTPKPIETRASEIDVPLPPLIDPQYQDAYLIPEELGLPLLNDRSGKMQCGKWYPVKEKPGIFVSALQPGMVAEDVFNIRKARFKKLDSIEKTAMVYLVAFDLNRYDLNFALGTEHPSVEWSSQALDAVKNDKLPGPDGIGAVSPLVNTGIVRPNIVNRVVSCFTGGFKRYHGAFRRGPLASKNSASHYGFIEHGVVFSKLQPGLATVIMHMEGHVVLKTWQNEDDQWLPMIRHARQNGVPIIEYDESDKIVQPTSYIINSLYGNWSGSAEGQYRTLRAGLAIQEDSDRRFLIYGYFSAATPSAMASVFLAYHCAYAMQTDMNALEHTYLAMYTRTEKMFQIHHLITGMNVLDKVLNGTAIPRFVGFPDNRDFFYLMKKDNS